MLVSIDKVPFEPEVTTKPLPVKDPNLTDVKEPPVKDAVPSVMVPKVPVPVVVKF